MYLHIKNVNALIMALNIAPIENCSYHFDFIWKVNLICKYLIGTLVDAFSLLETHGADIKVSQMKYHILDIVYMYTICVVIVFVLVLLRRLFKCSSHGTKLSFPMHTAIVSCLLGTLACNGCFDSLPLTCKGHGTYANVT